MKGIIGGILILEAKKTMGTFNPNRAAVGTAIAIWKPHAGKIPQKTP